MIALLLRGIALLLGLFTLAVGAIIAQPRDDAAMRAFFAPEDCAAPCFLGIRPGVTTHDQAVAILRANPWVEDVSGGADSISWRWNGQQPDFVSSLHTNILLAHVEFADGVVSTIRVQTTTRWADFYFLFGRPDRLLYQSLPTPSNLYRISDNAYFTRGFEALFSVRCPVSSREATWYSNVLVVWPVSSHVAAADDRFLRGC